MGDTKFHQMLLIQDGCMRRQHADHIIHSFHWMCSLSVSETTTPRHLGFVGVVCALPPTGL